VKEIVAIAKSAIRLRQLTPIDGESHQTESQVTKLIILVLALFIATSAAATPLAIEERDYLRIMHDAGKPTNSDRDAAPRFGVDSARPVRMLACKNKKQNYRLRRKYALADNLCQRSHIAELDAALKPFRRVGRRSVAWAESCAAPGRKVERRREIGTTF
jgi:hypothetical protein